MNIKISNLNRLNRWESFQFMENALAHIESHEDETSALYTSKSVKLNTSFVAFDEALVLERKTSPEGLVEAEEERDYGVRKIYTILREYSDYRYDKNKETAANVLLDSFKPYGTGSIIAAMSQESETAVITNLLQDLIQKEGNLAHLELLDLTIAINSLKVKNLSFKESQNTRLGDQAQFVAGVVKTARNEAEKDFITFIDTVNALSIVEGPEKYTDLKQKLNALNKQFQTTAKQRKKKKEEKEPEEIII